MRQIVLIEPSKTFSQFVSLALSRLGCQVVQVASAEAALDVLATAPTQLVLTEIKLPGQSGLDLIKTLKRDARFQQIPVVIITTDGLHETRQAASAAGCCDYLTKPVTARGLHEMIERALPFNHRRHHIRARMNVAARVTDGIKPMVLNTSYIGEGGVYLEAEQPYRVGAVIDISLPLPSLTAPIKLKGQVIYRSTQGGQMPPPGMGVKFINMDLNTSTLLKHYMESYLSDYLPETPPTE